MRGAFFQRPVTPDFEQRSRLHLPSLASRTPGAASGDSGNWPIPLIRRREPSVVSHELDARWFDAERPAPPERDELEPLALAPKSARSRLAHAAFFVIFCGVLALTFWEIRSAMHAGALPWLGSALARLARFRL
jgi:hypothetical protein